VVASGAQPIGATDCLNFGNPERPEVMWQFAMVIEGMAEACRALGVPIVSGNVSFYNETNGLGIYPTPVVGVVGKMPIDRVTTQWFKGDGDAVVLLGETKEELGGSEYLASILHREQGLPPELDLDAEKNLYGCCIELMASGLVRSAHDCSDGGLAVALAECCLAPVARTGATIDVANPVGIRRDAVLFGESQSRIIVSTRPELVGRVLDAAARWGVPAVQVGRTGGNRLQIAIDSEMTIDVAIDEAAKAWSEGLPSGLKGT
jgi:phosphoribosylformylglycinamidine synthase